MSTISKKIIIALIALSVFFPGRALALESPESTKTDSITTALAVFIGNVVNETLNDHERMGFTIDREQFLSRLTGFLSGQEAPMTAPEAQAFLQKEYNSVMPSNTVAELSASDPVRELEFLIEATNAPGAKVLDSGTVVETIVEGTGTAPHPAGFVEVRYRGVLSDGTVFDEITEGEQALTLPVDELTPGLTDALTSGILRSGGKYRLTLPASAAYGDEGVPGVIPAGATLQFELELINAE